MKLIARVDEVEIGEEFIDLSRVAIQCNEDELSMLIGHLQECLRDMKAGHILEGRHFHFEESFSNPDVCVVSEREGDS